MILYPCSRGVILVMLPVTLVNFSSKGTIGELTLSTRNCKDRIPIRMQQIDIKIRLVLGNLLRKDVMSNIAMLELKIILLIGEILNPIRMPIAIKIGIQQGNCIFS